jgi:hypothetical protein
MIKFNATNYKLSTHGSYSMNKRGFPFWGLRGSAGMYFIEFRFKDDKTVKKLIVE